MEGVVLGEMPAWSHGYATHSQSGFMLLTHLNFKNYTLGDGLGVWMSQPKDIPPEDCGSSPV